jgi:TonB-linked SusC/RagA family outer membrane protein
MKRLFYSSLILGLMLTVQFAFAQERVVSGKVTNAKGDPLPGATVLVKGTTSGAFVKSDGKYRVTVPPNGKSLVFKMVGMKTKEVVLSTSDNVDVKMEDDATRSEDVVVTAIGIEQQKRSLTYATQKVEGSALSQSKEANIVGGLAGKIAGVQVTNATGAAGGSSYIRIRGASSITGDNQPLFVIDGIPIDNSQLNTESGLAGVAYSNRAVDINPDDIESVNVLKGAAATSLYGIRAASGAIIITTKKGLSSSTVGRMSATFSTSLGIDQVNKLPELQMKYSQGLNGQVGSPASAAGLRPRSWGALLDTLRWVADPTYIWDKNGRIVGQSDPSAVNGKTVTPYDNVGDFFRTGYTTTNSFSLSGGNTSSNFYLSLSNMNQSGVTPKNTFDRTTLRLSGDHAFSTDLKVSGSVNYTKSGGTRIQQGSNISGVMLGLLRSPNTFDNSNGVDGAENSEAYQFADGRQRTYRGFFGFDNPYWVVNNTPFTDDVNRIVAYAQADYTPSDWISVMYRVGQDFYSDRRKQIYAVNSNSYVAGRIIEDQYFNSDFTSDLIVTLRKNFDEKMKGSLILGQNMYSKNLENLYAFGDDLVIPGFYNMSNARTLNPGQGLISKRTAALYADAKLEYDNYLYLNATLRNEWSTTLPEANNSFMFGSGSVGLVLSELMGPSEEINFLKLRASYALVGKDAPIYATQTLFTKANVADGWTNGITFPFNGSAGFQMSSSLGASDLKPEMKSEIEIGLEGRLFNNSVTFDINYYDNTSTDQIFAVPVAASSGYTSKLMNAGSIKNSGIEIQLGGRLFDMDGFTADLNVNWAKNVSEVVSLAEGVENIYINGFTGSQIRAVAGKPYGTIFGGKWERNENGDRVIGANGYPVVSAEEGELGNINPDWIAGTRLTLGYKGLTVSALLDIKQGGVMWNGTKGALLNYGVHKETENRGSLTVFEGVRQVNGTWVKNDTAVPLSQAWYLGNGGGFGSQAEEFVEDASYVRLRELTISYDLPSSMLEGSMLSRIGFSFTGRNLWLSTPYTGIDPETSLIGNGNGQGMDYFQFPNTKSYVFSLSLGF